MSRRSMFMLFGLLFTLAGPATASATTLDYPSFSSVAGLQLNGNAKQEGAVLRLAPAESGKPGSAFATTPVDPRQSFATRFQLVMHDSACCLSEPADGIAFVIQSAGVTGGKALGGSLGYGGIAPSVAVEFDLYHNSFDPIGRHVAIVSEGKPETHLQCANEGPPSFPCGASLPVPLYGSPVYGWVEYDIATQHLKVFVSGTGDKPAAPLLDYQISLAPIADTAFAGFTAATGSHNAVHDVLSWHFETLGLPGPTPPPTGPAPSAGPAPAPAQSAKPKPEKKRRKCPQRPKGKAKGQGAKASAAKAKAKGGKQKCGKRKGKGSK